MTGSACPGSCEEPIVVQGDEKEGVESSEEETVGTTDLIGKGAVGVEDWLIVVDTDTRLVEGVITGK